MGDVGSFSGCDEVTGVGKAQYLVVTGRRPSWESDTVLRPSCDNGGVCRDISLPASGSGSVILGGRCGKGEYVMNE